jgi:hypothetical protein
MLMLMCLRATRQIVAAYPEGWMSSGQISRDGALVISSPTCLMSLIIVIIVLVSAMKKKLEREALEQENDD